ncbi:transposase IS116/IS110/IS902 family protein [Azoarcus sp. KH32C]|nr:transposase IS116/IS110/IS902 family protein [Azoarcus sp. KH32C]
MGIGLRRKESEMHATTVAVDLAKSVFQIAVADDNWKVVEQHRLTRSQFERWFGNREVALVIMEACGSAHHWGRRLRERGIEVKLLPAAYIRAYVKRNKTDRADACALLEAARCADIVPVRVKSVEQQALQGLHRIRSLWMTTRTSRINALRGFCREFGEEIPQGARTGVEAISRVLADPHSPVPSLIRETMRLLVEEIRLLEQRIAQLERELTEVARHSPACTHLMSVPGIGLLTATAMVAATGGNVTHFKDARHFASWFGITPKEYSSGNNRKLGRISKRGDRYLRMLLTHGARAVLRAAALARSAGRNLDGLRLWATEIQARANHNKAACALANKLARLCFAVLRDHAPYGNPQPCPMKKLERTAFAIAA